MHDASIAAASISESYVQAAMIYAQNVTGPSSPNGMIVDRIDGNVTDVRWVSGHWWSRRFELSGAGKIFVTARFRGSRGTAVVGRRRYDLRRFREPLTTISDGAGDELVARLSFVPIRGGMPAEFADGESFLWGRVKLWRRQWAWTNEAGETVLSSRRSGFPVRYELHVEPAADTKTWPILALFELAARELSRPWL